MGEFEYVLLIELRRRDSTFQEILDAIEAATCVLLAHTIAVACDLQRAGVKSSSAKHDTL